MTLQKEGQAKPTQYLEQGTDASNMCARERESER